MGPLTVAGPAAAEQAGFGLFNAVFLPASLVAAAVLVLLDLAVWALHLAMHKAPLLLWMHRLHHADRDLGLMSGLRFHPFEAAGSMLWKTGAVFAPFKAATDYWPAEKAFMLNCRVSGLDALLASLRGSGIAIGTRADWDTPEAGQFARVYDGRANRSSYGSPLPWADQK